MKTVAILGSPHGWDGNTGTLLKPLIDTLQCNENEVETFMLHRMDVRPCRACDVCHRTGECAQDDDFESVREAMIDAEAVVVASPN
ncbi:MAG: flavodoxin family protein, partial [Planctomycetota bacterium]